LVDKGWVKVRNYSHLKNKFGFIYVLTTKGILEKVILTGRFLKCKQIVYEALRAKIEPMKSESSGLAERPNLKLRHL
jgi:hypothetical protein